MLGCSITIPQAGSTHENNKPNKAQHDNRLTRSESNFHRDYNHQPTVNARLPSGGVCALTLCAEQSKALLIW